VSSVTNREWTLASEWKRFPFVPLAPVRRRDDLCADSERGTRRDIAVPARRGHRELAAFHEHYPLLLGLNAAIALALLGLVAFQLSKLARQRGRKCSGRC